jgi:small conductance mechanosensitive channel
MKEKIIDFSEKIIPWLSSHGIKIILIVLGAFILTKVLYKFIEKAVRIAVLPDEHSSPDAEKQREDTLIQIFNATIKIAMIVFTSLMVLQEMGVLIAPILAGVGIIGIALGFGGQYLIRDVITGLFIILENQYRIGDSVDIDGTKGSVEKISLRMTRLRDIDGTVHHIPHGEIKIVSNLSKNFARVNLNVGVAYHSNIDAVIAIINQVGNELAKDPQYSGMILSAPQFLRVDNLGDSSIDLKILGETIPLKQWEVTGELRKRLKKAFDENNIEIPFPQRVVHHIKEQ